MGATGAQGATGASGARGASGASGSFGTPTIVSASGSFATSGAGTTNFTATCTTGHVLGGGASLTGGTYDHHLAIIKSFPSSSTVWQATVSSDQSESGWTVTVYAICGP